MIARRPWIGWRPIKGEAFVTPSGPMKTLVLKFLIFVIAGALAGGLFGYIQQCTGGG